MPERIRLVIADDHPIVRKGLRAAVEERPGVTVVGEAGDGEAALDLIASLTPDVAVIDIDMPKRDGIAVAREVVARRLPTKLLFLTLHRDLRVFRVALDLGVQGYLLKDSAMLEIAAAVGAVAAGRPYYSSEMAAQMIAPQAGPSSPPETGLLAPLTPAERRIMRLIADGLSSKEIGASLSIHYRTVDNHRTNISRKLGLEGANALVRFALQHKSTL